MYVTLMQSQDQLFNKNVHGYIRSLGQGYN